LEKDPLHAILEEVRDSWGIRSPEEEHWQSKKRKSAGEYEWVLQNLQLTKNDTLLDIGCGTGLFLEYISELVNNAIGVDISKTMLKKARRHTTGKNNITLVHAAAPLLPFCKPVFNKIVIVHAAFGVLLPNPHLWNIYQNEMMDLSVNVIKNAFELLTPQGVLIITLAPGTKEMAEKVKKTLIPEVMEKAKINKHNANLTIRTKKLENTHFALVKIEKQNPI
jgi:SAM-dependent methyltransferase